MSSSIPYSAEPDDLFYPCKRGEFFPAGRPELEAALCAEMARLAYCKQTGRVAARYIRASPKGWMNF